MRETAMKKKLLSIVLSMAMVIGMLPTAAFAESTSFKTASSAMSFTDVESDAYYHDPVLWAVEKGVTSGTSKTTFSPKDTCTRGQVVTFLWRAAGQPEPLSSANPFRDVKSDAYYNKAVQWAVEKGITSGISKTEFGPENPCTRAQVVTFQWRSKGKPDPVSCSNPFRDVRSNDYYYNSVLWAVEKSITSGVSAHSFAPDSACTRGQIVTFLYRQFQTEGTGKTIPVDYEADSIEEYGDQLADLIKDYNGRVDTDTVSAQDAYEGKLSGRVIVSSGSELPDNPKYTPDVVLKDGENNYIIQFRNAQDAINYAEYLNTISSVRYAEIDKEVTLCEDNENSQPHSWGVSKTGSDQFASKLAAKGKTESVTVAVIDTGADQTHPFLKDRILSGYDFYDGDDDPSDKNSHGTHVSGIIVDCTPGLNIKILPVKTFGDDKSSSVSTIIQGIRYAAEQKADVMNLSLTCKDSTALDDAVQQAVKDGITVVAAAGNNNGSDTKNYSPARAPNAITVSAVDSNLNAANFSNCGDAVDLCAPGVGIKSSVPGGSYESKSGTSMAAPYVSAAAAMLLLYSPSLEPFWVRMILKQAAVDLGPEGWDKHYGSGFLNAGSIIKDDTPVENDTTDVKIGDIVTLGSYEQDNNLLNGREAIQWIVLKKENGKALLLSKYALDAQPYNNEYGLVTWETCTLRTWLNNTFYNTAFSSSDKLKIESTRISNPDTYIGYDVNDDYIGNNTGDGIIYLSYHTDGGNDTTDKVFLLSIDEAKDLLGYDRAFDGDYPNMKAAATEYAKAQGAWSDSSYLTEEGGACSWWWLRSPGYNNDFASYILYSGRLDQNFADNIHYAVRPALWINLTSK